MLKQGHDGIVLGGFRYFFVIRLKLVKALIDDNDVDVVVDDNEWQWWSFELSKWWLAFITCCLKAGASNDEHVDNDDDDEISDVDDDAE